VRSANWHFLAERAPGSTLDAPTPDQPTATKRLFTGWPLWQASPMLKKLGIAIAASAFAVTLAAPVASACPGMEKPATADKDSKEKVAKKDSKKAAKKAKAHPKKVAKKTDKK